MRAQPRKQASNMTPEQLIERVKSLGVEFWQPSETLEAMLKQTEAARIMRIDRLKDFVRINAERLAKIKEEIRTLPEQIAKWEAERAHLEASTAVGLVMGREVKPESGELVYTAKPPGQVLVDGKQEDPFIPGLPPLRLREAWAEWCILERGEPADFPLVFSRDGLLCKWADGKEWFAVVETSAIWEGRTFRPHGKTRAEVEAMADAAEQKPALLDLRDVRYGVWFRMTADCPPLKRGEVFRVSWRSWVGEHINQVSVALDDDGHRRIELPHGLHELPAELVPARVVEVPR